MANVKYGVNIIPRVDNTYTIGNSDYKWSNIYTNKINGTNIEKIIEGGESGQSVGVITPTFTATSGYFISNTGVKSSSQYYSISPPIPMSEGDIISLIATGYSNSVAMISLSNEEGTSFTPVINSIDSNEHEYIYHVVNDGYYIISYKNYNATYILTQYTKNSFYAVRERIKTIEDLNLQGLIDNEKYNPLYTNVTATMSDDGHFIQRNGAYQSASSFYLSSSITIPANSLIVFNAQGYQNNVAILAQVKDNTYIPLIISEDSNEHTFSYITYDKINVLISSNKAVTPIYSIYSSRIDTLDGRVNNIENDLFAFTTMGVIGDSLASGSSNYNDGVSDNPNYSWGKCIERIYGTEVILFTKGGFTTQSWLTDSAGLSALQSEKALDCYVIGLGQNDAYSLGDAYLGTISDISIGNESSNADSYYGNYSKIIAAIQTKSPNAKIFCLTNAKPISQTKLNYNSAIDDIVELYDNTYLVDLAADPFYSSSIFNATWSGAHSTPAGYRLIAKNIHDNICKVIRQNITDFTNILTWANTTPLSLHSLKNSIDTKTATMTGATVSAAGTKGTVPAPAAGDQDKYLKGDGTWDKLEAIEPYETINTPATIQSFNDGVIDVPMEIMVGIEPVQDLHGYEYPWVGGSGKNKWNPDGTGTEWLGVDATTPSDRTGAKSMRFSCSEGDKIAVSMENTSTSSNILLIATLDSNGEKLTRTVVNTGATSLGITAGTNATQFLVSFFTASETGWVQVEFGTETATSYAPYSNICPISGWTGANVTVSPTSSPDDPDKEVYSITFPTPPGTVYRGTLKVNKDGSGVLTDKFLEYVFDNSRSYVPVQSTAGYWYIISAVSGFKNNTLNGCSNGYLPIASPQPNRYRPVNGYIYLYDQRFTSSEAVAQILADQPVQVVSERSAYQTYNLTAEQVGKILSLNNTNNIWCDAGIINEITYAKQNIGLITTEDKVKLDNIPAVTSSDNGKILRVINGSWAATLLSNAEEVSF